MPLQGYPEPLPSPPAPPRAAPAPDAATLTPAALVALWKIEAARLEAEARRGSPLPGPEGLLATSAIAALAAAYRRCAESLGAAVGLPS